MDVAKALIVDDEPDILELVSLSFATIGLHCTGAGNVTEAKQFLSEQAFDICITDMRLPDGDGLEIISYIQEHHPELPVAMMTAHGNVECAVEALKRGAFDFVSKPVDLDFLRNLALGAVRMGKAKPEAEALLEPSSEIESNVKGLIGSAPTMQKVRQMIAKLARSQAPVLIRGESGTGKELAARAIHTASPRSDGPFIPVNCGAIPEALMESEFFGHKKGSFTGANTDKAGLFQSANGGTLFLDEVADLPHPMQVKLLRAIQERAVRPVGGMQEIPADVRIVSATHRNLEQMVEKGDFRQDLFYRLNVLELQLPPLRERREDLPDLCLHVLARINRQSGLKVRITQEAIQRIMSYSFPGNVRELENLLERAAALCDGDTIQADDLILPKDMLSVASAPSPESKVHKNDAASAPARAPSPAFDSTASSANEESPESKEQALAGLSDIIGETDLESYIAEVERNAIRQALKATGNNRTAAAKLLGISFRAMRYRLSKLNMLPDGEDE